MRKYGTAILLSISVGVGELHTFWNKSEEVQNWILRAYKPMPVSWNIKYVEIQAIPIIYFIAWLLYIPNKANRTAVWSMLLLAIMDTILYFYDFKQGDFGAVYFWYGGFFLLIFFGKKISKWLWQTLHPNAK